jgi:hypothetical protein
MQRPPLSLSDTRTRPSDFLVRAVLAHARSIAFEDPDILGIASKAWPNDRGTLQLIKRSASVPADTTSSSVTGWAADLAAGTVPDLLNVIGPASAGAQLLQRGQKDEELKEKPRPWLVRGEAEISGYIRGRGFRTKAIRGEGIGSAARQDRQEKPRRSGARTSWKEVKMKRAQHQQQNRGCFEIEKDFGLQRKEEPRPRAGFSSFGGGILV